MNGRTLKRDGWFVALALLACVCAAPRTLHAQDAADDQRWVELGREAFSEGGYPWYDQATDSLQPIEVERRDNVPDMSWLVDSLAWLAKALAASMKIIVWTLLAIVLAVIAFLLVHYFRTRQARQQRKQAAGDAVLPADQVESLPFLAERPRGDLLGEARRHYEAGNYSEAIIYLFSYQLTQLDKFSIIRLAKGKTNRQYLGEVGRKSALRSPLELTLVTFEGVFFGRRPLDRDGFEACWRELPAFEQHLQAAP